MLIRACVLFLMLAIPSEECFSIELGNYYYPYFANLGFQGMRLTLSGENLDQRELKPMPPELIALAKEIYKEQALTDGKLFWLEGALDGVATLTDIGILAAPEPLTKAAFAVLSSGFREAKDYSAALVIEGAEKKINQILAQGLKNQQLKESDFKLPHDQLMAKVNNIKIGTSNLKEILKDNSSAQSRIDNYIQNTNWNISIEALKRSELIGNQVDEVREDLYSLEYNLSKFEGIIYENLDQINRGLGTINSKVISLENKVNDLATITNDHDHSIRAIAKISYSGWSTAQQLDAVRSGIVFGLNDKEKSVLEDKLILQLEKEDAIKEFNLASARLGNFSSLIKSFGAPDEFSQAIDFMQNGSILMSNLLSGNLDGYLTSANIFAAMVGFGKQDRSSMQHGQVMGMLKQLDQKMTLMIELQKQTYAAIKTLEELEKKLHVDTMHKLGLIEEEVLTTKQITQALLLSEWRDCYSFMNGLSVDHSRLNSPHFIASKVELEAILNDPYMPGYASECESVLRRFLTSVVQNANWNGSVISFINFPDIEIESTTIKENFSIYKARQKLSYLTARSYLAERFKSENEKAKQLSVFVRMLHPQSTINQQQVITKRLLDSQILSELNELDCDVHNNKKISVGLFEYFCPTFNSNSLPSKRLWNSLIIGDKVDLIGPLAFSLIDTGIVLSSILDISTVASNKVIFFRGDELADPLNFSAKYQVAIKQSKAKHLLKKISLISDGNLIQQSMMSGDFIAQLIEAELYDPVLRALNLDIENISDAEKKARKGKAIEAMKSNPPLARNVVLIAMRHALIDRVGGIDAAEKIDFERTNYQLSLSNFSMPDACSNRPYNSLYRGGLERMFPNWTFENFVKSAEGYEGCALRKLIDKKSNDVLDYGEGVSVKLNDFYVQVPDPIQFSKGELEITESLKWAVNYKKRVSDSLVDKELPILIEKSLANSKTTSTSDFIKKILTINY